MDPHTCSIQLSNTRPCYAIKSGTLLLLLLNVLDIFYIAFKPMHTLALAYDKCVTLSTDYRSPLKYEVKKYQALTYDITVVPSEKMAEE